MHIKKRFCQFKNKNQKIEKIKMEDDGQVWFGKVLYRSDWSLLFLNPF